MLKNEKDNLHFAYLAHAWIPKDVSLDNTLSTVIGTDVNRREKSKLIATLNKLLFCNIHYDFKPITNNVQRET